MRLSDEKFFKATIDHRIPELAKASALFAQGKQQEAEKAVDNTEEQ